MSETTNRTTGLTTQYSAQVAGDLEHNRKEQERLAGEIETLQKQLAAVRHDHTVLVNLQEALRVPAVSDTAASELVTAVPAPREEAASRSAVKPSTGEKPTLAKKTGTSKKAAAAKPSPRPAGVKLVDLVRKQLAGQKEPHSAAEITTALVQRHPERTVKATVVRATLEGLVARNQAQRIKQGTSVFYTAPEAAAPTADGQTPLQSA
ncbi:hypothetical protein ACFV2H_52830 [Streptomyces sp. NPDC059629]|uniref:hypothetical protein n=1 Tax=Streptomyces sp. NPDC059629 TaxID=3346889 RepID=UPI0036C9F943